MSALYDPEFWKIVWNGIPILGFVTGSFLKVTRRVETTSLIMGADSRGTFVINHDRSAMVEFTLRREHITNKLLSAKLDVWERGGIGALQGIGPLLVEQTHTGTKTEGQFAALVKRPDQEGGTDYSPIVWQLLVEDAVMFDGAAGITGRQVTGGAR